MPARETEKHVTLANVVTLPGSTMQPFIVKSRLDQPTPKTMGRIKISRFPRMAGTRLFVSSISAC